MRNPARRPLVLSVSLALLLGVTAAAAPVLAGPPPTHTRVAGIDVDATTIPQLESLMNRHRLTSVQLTQLYLRRIRKLDPELHALITVNAAALATARAADAARRHGDRRPLLGLPIIVKDNIDTTGMPTTAGSWALAGSAPSDAFIVGRLKAAGAFILGKANLSEWANFRSGPSSSGWSGIGGQVNMAYVLDRNPCGSSSGSAVASSADLSVAAVGTETDGSVVCPSGANGLAGVKPSLGLLSRAGIVPISADQDTAGPIARNVTDAAALLGAMTGVDAHDPATAAQAGHAFTDYTVFLDPHALRGKRIGVWRELAFEVGGQPVDPAVSAIMDDAISVLRAQGATIVDPADIVFGDWANAEFPALLCEFKSDIASYLQTDVGPGYPKTLQDLIHFNNAHPELESGAPASDWNNAVFDQAEATNGRDQDCADFRAIATPGARAAIDDLMAANHLDAIVSATNGPAWVTDPVNGDLGGDFSHFIGSSGPAAVAGYPAVTVAAGFDGPLPIGITFMGGRWSEPELLADAYAFEQASHARTPPTFIPTIGPGDPSAASARATGPHRGHGIPARKRPTGWRPMR